MTKLASQIEHILATGASVTISTEGRLSSQLEKMAAIAKKSGSTLTVTGADKLLEAQLVKIGTIGGSNVHFVL